MPLLELKNRFFRVVRSNAKDLKRKALVRFNRATSLIATFGIYVFVLDNISTVIGRILLVLMLKSKQLGVM